MCVRIELPGGGNLHESQQLLEETIFSFIFI